MKKRIINLIVLSLLMFSSVSLTSCTDLNAQRDAEYLLNANYDDVFPCYVSQNKIDQYDSFDILPTIYGVYDLNTNNKYDGNDYVAVYTGVTFFNESTCETIYYEITSTYIRKVDGTIYDFVLANANDSNMGLSGFIGKRYQDEYEKYFAKYLKNRGFDNKYYDNLSSSSQEIVDEGKKYTIGIGYDVTYSWESTYAKYDIVAAFVAFDLANDKVCYSRLDEVEIDAIATDSKDGLKLVSNAKLREDKYVKTKVELGKEYGMVGNGAIAEIDKQIEAYSKWTIGKNIEEITGSIGAKDEGGQPIYSTDSELLASCTISVDKYAAAFENAYRNRENRKYLMEDDLKAGIALNAGVAFNYGNPSKDISIDIAGAIINNEGVAEAACIDTIVISNIILESGRVSIDYSSKFHSGSSSNKIYYLSKKILGDEYGMYPTSQTEWYYQANAIEIAVEGKNAEEISVLVKYDKASEDKTNMIAGATITVSSYVSALKRAVLYANMENIGPQ